MGEWKATELGRVPSHWEVLPIGDLGDVTKLAGFEYTKFINYVDDGEIIALRALNVRDGILNLTDVKRIKKEVSDSLIRSKLFKGDILLTYVGANIGQFAMINEDDKYHLAPNICRIRVHEKCDSYYLYSYFRTSYFQDNLTNYQVGSSQPTMPMENIRKILIPLPPLTEQKAIASVLSSLDDKIDLLHRQNKTLEAMAETLFRQWFVQEAQEDWEEGCLGDVIELVYGKGLKKEIRTGTGYPVIGSSGIVGYHSEFLVEAPGIVIGRKGTLGKVIYLWDNFFPIDTTYYIKSKVESAGLLYEYFLLKTLNFEEMNSDSAVPGLNRDIALSTEIKIAPLRKLQEFNQFTSTFIDKLRKNTNQIRTLEKLRNTLLPKLMSGEVRVQKKITQEIHMLKKIWIEGLFNMFNYEIELKDGGITILTGPNGYGKTTILKIIYAFAVKDLIFFFQLPFKKIVLIQESNEIRLSKTEPDELEMQWGNKESKIYKKNEITKIYKQLLAGSSYMQVDENSWHDRITGTFYTEKELFSQLFENNPEIQAKHDEKQMPDFTDVYLIEEQRLISKNTVRRGRQFPFDPREEIRESFSSTIKEYAVELSECIKDILANASKIGQELDSSFPRRLFDETGKISEEGFNERYDVIKEKQKSLSLYGLSTTEEDGDTTFKEENATALLVYLNDTEKKLAVFDEILEKLQIFSNILNEKQFVEKQLVISPDFGFRFNTEDGKELPLTELSSGEQQEVVLLYELLFKVSPNTLVLIDEPEISLHVAWQKEFLNDLLKIVKLRKIAIITATHSPQIIDTHWDLVIDLWDLMAGAEENSG